MFERDWTTSSIINSYFTLNSDCNWKDLCVRLRNQQTFNFDNHDQRSDFQFGFYICFHYRFVEATQVLVYETDW
jgi:hypothetical protein